jgi:hypothetical protein
MAPSVRATLGHSVQLLHQRPKLGTNVCAHLPCFPFSSRICLNQHHWLANRMREQGIGFKQLTNAFLRCSAPDRLQEFADSLTPRDLVTCGQKWLARLTPFFTAKEREHAGCQHRLFFSQVENCDNLIFRRRVALDNLSERLLDANRTIGQPDKITIIFGRKVTKHYRGKLQTERAPTISQGEHVSITDVDMVDGEISQR